MYGYVFIASMFRYCSLNNILYSYENACATVCRLRRERVPGAGHAGRGAAHVRGHAVLDGARSHRGGALTPYPTPRPPTPNPNPRLSPLPSPASLFRRHFSAVCSHELHTVATVARTLAVAVGRLSELVTGHVRLPCTFAGERSERET